MKNCIPRYDNDTGLYIAREACAYANPVALYVTLKGLNYNIGI